MTFLSQLEVGLQALQLPLTQRQKSQLMSYVELLQKWNKAYNLTAIREPEKMLSLHLLDSLSISQHIVGDFLADVGTGAGLPGIPLAILHPQKKFVLIDSNGKKVRFLFQAIKTLELDNVCEVQTRVENYHPTEPFDGVLSRAYASIFDMVSSCKHLLHEDGHFFAMKGKYPKAELSQLPKGYIVNSAREITVPGIEGERHLIDLSFTEEFV